MAFPETISEPAGDLNGVAKSDGVDLCPLSFAQRRLWFLDQLQPGDPAYNIPQAWRLHGPLNTEAFQEAVDELVRRHESLRTVFDTREGRPVQVISPPRPVVIAIADFSRDDDPEAAAQRWIRRDAREPFDLRRGPLFRVARLRIDDHEHIALFNLHHIISDAWSFEILRSELSPLYEAACAGLDAALPELPIQYLDYAHWQREQLNDQRLQTETEFWRQRLSGGLPALELPLDHPRARAHNSRGRSAPFELSREEIGALRELGRRQGATLFMVLMAGFNAFLHHLTGQEDFVVGTPISGRDRTETEGLIGLFVNTLALRTDVSGDPTFLELLARVRETVLDAFAHQEMPFEELVRALQPERAPGQNPLFQAVLALQNGYPHEWMLGNLRAMLIDVETQTAKFDWTFLLEEVGGGMKGYLEYRADLFEPDTIARFLRYFRVVLNGAAADPESRLSALPMMTDAERRQVLVEWNETATAYERDACIHELFEAQAEKTPDAEALIFGERRMTYGELNRAANRLANRLKQCGAGPGVPVGVGLERSPEMIVAMLAILKSGGAYVPLDRGYPGERLAFMLRDAAVSLLVTDSSFDAETFSFRNPDLRPGEGRGTAAATDGGTKTVSPRLSPVSRANGGNPMRVIRIESENVENESAENLSSAAGPEDLAYVMYTSGSTGTPKGTAIPHRGVVRLVRHTDYVEFSADDVFLQLAPISFDASTFEIWGCLLNGGALIIFPPHLPSLEELGNTIRECGVTTLWLTAGLFHQMVDHQLENLKLVRQLIAGGDVLSPSHVHRALRELPGCQLINGYGPTENTTFTCCYPFPSHWRGSSAPIGRPISNTRVFVLDNNLSPVPVGVPGELCIGGDGLARNYLNRPELTAEKFVPDPFHPNDPGARLYRTGDRVRWRPDGNLEFLGRRDQQVKIRGFRVETGEIEAVLARHPAVREAAVIARETPSRDRQLVAYVVPGAESHADPASLRKYLEDKLPAWMLPAHFVELEKLPLTANGKVDRRALPAPETAPCLPGPGITPPRSPTEETLAGIWREVLGRNAFDIHENFFHLGGHSLLATRMISRIARAFRIELPVRAVFEAPTIAKLAEEIGRASRPGAGPAGIPRRIRRAQAEQLLTKLATMTDAEVETLLESPDLRSS